MLQNNLLFVSVYHADVPLVHVCHVWSAGKRCFAWNWGREAGGERGMFGKQDAQKCDRLSMSQGCCKQENETESVKVKWDHAAPVLGTINIMSSPLLAPIILGRCGFCLSIWRPTGDTWENAFFHTSIFYKEGWNSQRIQFKLLFSNELIYKKEYSERSYLWL